MASAGSSSPSPGQAAPSIHEKFYKHFFYKSAQIIVQSRLGEKAACNSQPSPSSSSAWFNLAIKDIPEIALEARKSYAGGSTGSHTIEISLKTTEGDSMILETWCISMNSENRDPNIKLNNSVYNHLGLLLKSVLCVSRVTPAYKFSRRQGPDTFVVCYRIYAGEPTSPSLLGQGYQSCCIGQVLTPIGSISIKVDYRTEMTITPTASISSNLMLVRSDHFEAGATTKKSKSSDESSAITSDESQEAFRLFSSDTPQTHHQQQQPLPTPSSSNDEDDGSLDRSGGYKFKFGAFATSPRILKDEEDDDPLFNFLPQDNEPPSVTEEREADKEEEEEEEYKKEPDPFPQVSAPTKDHEFEVLDNLFENTKIDVFDLKPAAAEPSKSELGIFFKAKPDMSLGATEKQPLGSIDEQLISFEKCQEKYDQMIKALDSLTSESEPEGS